MNDSELLKAKLWSELTEISHKSALNVKDLELAHILTDTIKNIDKISALENGEYPVNSIAPASIPQRAVSYNSDSDFSKLVCGKDSEKVWKVMEELVESLSVLLPNLYTTVCEKFRNI